VRLLQQSAPSLGECHLPARRILYLLYLYFPATHNLRQLLSLCLSLFQILSSFSWLVVSSCRRGCRKSLGPLLAPSESPQTQPSTTTTRENCNQVPSSSSSSSSVAQFRRWFPNWDLDFELTTWIWFFFSPQSQLLQHSTGGMFLDQPVSGSTLTSSTSAISPCLIRRLRPDSSKTQVVVEELCNSEVYQAVTSFEILVAGCCISCGISSRS